MIKYILGHYSNLEKVLSLKVKLVIVKNNAQEVPGVNTAFRKRIVVIHLRAHLLTPALKKNFFFPEDSDIEDKIFRYRNIFISLILDKYSKFVERGLEVPQYI